jgi:cob(I)alamin adenosyltransferase
MKITKIRQISTTTGDDGKSRNFSNETLLKSDILFHLLGDLDELSSWIGLVYHFCLDENLKTIQTHLMRIASEIATNPTSKAYELLQRVGNTEVEWIEALETSLLQEQQLESAFLLPGSERSLTGAYFDVCRTVARRTERTFVAFTIEKQREDLLYAGKYLNRLSDLLFLFAGRK